MQSLKIGLDQGLISNQPFGFFAVQNRIGRICLPVRKGDMPVSVQFEHISPGNPGKLYSPDVVNLCGRLPQMIRYAGTALSGRPPRIKKLSGLGLKPRPVRLSSSEGSLVPFAFSEVIFILEPIISEQKN